MIAEQISHYRIIDKLGAGGMGEVWRARDTQLNRKAEDCGGAAAQ